MRRCRNVRRARHLDVDRRAASGASTSRDHRTCGSDRKDDGQGRGRAPPFRNRDRHHHVGHLDEHPATGGRATDQRTQVEDRALVDAVLAGDRDAFRTLVDREAPVVLAVCRRILSDPTDAEDAAQEAFLIAYRKIGTFRGDGPLGGWLMRIAIREARDRAVRRRPEPSLDDGIGSQLAATVRTTDDPLASAEGRERRAALLAAIADLPAHYRDAVSLRYIDELSFSEISAATGRPEATVRTHLHRGLLRLRERLSVETRA
jgi:RNA polymerase sigma-70 factor, ECF subfamily